MSHHNTLNTRLLPLSILISSLVSGGAVAASTTAVTPNISNGSNTQITSRLTANNNVANNKKPEDILLETFFPAGQPITSQMKTEAESQIAAIKSDHQQQIVNIKAAIDTMAPEQKKQANKELATFEKVFAKNMLGAEAALTYAKDQSDDNKNKLLQAAKNAFATSLETKAPGQFTPEEADSLFNSSLTQDQSTLSPVIKQKITAIEQQQQTDKDALNKLQDYLNQGLITSEQKEKLVTQLADKKTKLDTQAVAKQAQEAAEKVEKAAKVAELKLTMQSIIADSKAKIAEKAKNDAEAEFTKLDTEKMAAIKDVDPSWDANTPDLATKLQDLIADQNTPPLKIADAKTAQESIAKAEAANQLVQDATTAHITAQNSAQDTTAKFTAAKQHKLDATAELTTKKAEMDVAVAELALFDKATDPTVDMPVFDKIIAKSELQTVTANTMAMATQVSGGTQHVEKDGQVIGSIISEDGTLNLAVGALAHDTVINKGIINNNGGTDHDSVINDGGKLSLKGEKKQDANGKDVINVAESYGAKILEGGTATVGKFAEIHNLSSTKGTVELKDGAKAFNTAIDGGTLTIEKGANSQHTSLDGANLELIEGATADSTKVGEDAVFTLKANAKTSGTEVRADNSEFTLEKGSSAFLTHVLNGTMTVNDGASADEVNVTDEGTLILKSGAVVKSAKISDRAATFTLESGATATGTLLNFAELALVKGATADDTTLLDGSTFTLLEGAETKNTSIGSDSNFIANTKATANNTTINGGKFRLEQGAIANITALDSGEFIIDGTANNTTVTGGKFALNKGATANTTTLNSGDFIVDGAANNTTVTGGKFALNQGAIANTTTLNDGEFIVDGTANNTTVKGGKFALNQGATANITTLNEGEFTVKAGAKTTATTVNGGIFDVQAGAAIEDTVFNAVDFTLVDKATANNTTVNDSKLTINEGAIANNTKVKGGKFDLMARAQAHKLVVENGHSLISGHLMDATFNSSTVIFDKTADINGIIDANKNSFLSVQGGATTQNADLNLAGNMQLFSVDAPLTAVQSASRAAFAGNNGKPAQFAFKNVRLAGGSIDMSKSNTQLTMASLAGRGLFNLGSALFSQSSAPLKVAGDAAGTFDVQINNSGVAPANLNVVDVKGKNTAHFVLANGPVDLGNYKHSLVSDGKGSFKLVADKTKVTSNTAGILAVANTMPVIFNAELSSIHNRLDKQSSAANESGVWLTYLNDSYDVKGTATNFNQKLSGVTLGGDKAIELGNAVFSVGSFASHTSSNIKSDYQSSGSVESNSLGAYVQYLANSGYYLNGVFKTNQFKQNLSVASQANNATGAANFSGMGLAVKAGKHINIDAMYVSPYVALNTFSSGKSQYKLSNGMEAQNQGSRTTTGTLGMNTGYRFVLNSGAEIKPYAIFSVDHDLMASNKVMINNDMFDNNLKGTRANVGMGINVNLTSNLSIGSEVKVSKGKNITTPMTINMGVAYTF
ncbi:outer membrane autotransporter barrel domain protein [Yersinia rochesterensis]|uniref:Outer membrane autotransporter barrel domain protein n=1 Tax=Yersinia rochesterensis TaxID=1604335 RepID=A0ABN4FG17_9GAMM|nr:autotransporter outer membrane beta-barrel domain-containing protein [Yersinia rochesterensis]AIN16684.1 outer membrane autotransporter barrel domain protein [Yersinia rochesterensis]AJI88791.1 outer membrane autotransporter barrel domain protein [Yersinia frederiksenii Y225]AJJ36602.1 outer membrane autotransporter barrel domain protein [Yersinia rochesterensis]CRY60198.1 autotransporter protein [Yersinia kristensenii]